MVYLRADDVVNASASLNGGFLKDLYVTDCSVYDYEGARFDQFAFVMLSAGLRLDGLTVRNCPAYVRTRGTESTTQAFFDFRFADDGDEGTRKENVLFDSCSLIDMHQGVDEGETDDFGVTAVGHPVETWSNNDFPALAVSNGEVRNIEIRDCRLDGARGSGIKLSAVDPEGLLGSPHHCTEDRIGFRCRKSL